jgi:hypothetical protein
MARFPLAVASIVLALALSISRSAFWRRVSTLT